MVNINSIPKGIDIDYEIKKIFFRTLNVDARKFDWMCIDQVQSVLMWTFPDIEVPLNMIAETCENLEKRGILKSVVFDDSKTRKFTFNKGRICDPLDPTRKLHDREFRDWCLIQALILQYEHEIDDAIEQAKNNPAPIGIYADW